MQLYVRHCGGLLKIWMLFMSYSIVMFMYKNTIKLDLSHKTDSNINIKQKERNLYFALRHTQKRGTMKTPL